MTPNESGQRGAEAEEPEARDVWLEIAGRPGVKAYLADFLLPQLSAT